MLEYNKNKPIMIKVKKRLPQKKYMDLTPMIDIVFLLVIFFMTSSSLVKIKAIKVDLPKAAKTDTNIKEPLTVSIDKDENLYVLGKKVSVNSIESILKTQIEKNEIKAIVVEGYQGISYQRIIEIMSLAKKVGVEKVSLAVQQE